MVGVDTGGTFTDVVAVVDGRLVTRKVPSTPADPSVAVRQAIRTLVGRARVRVHYGSTVATNALLERRGARVALLTTAGFEDVLEIGRQTRPDLYDLAPHRPAPLVPADRRIAVLERTLVDGRIDRRLTSAELRRLVRRVERLRVQAVAICLLHSYVAPRHERALARALAGRGLHVTASASLLREHREFERCSTTVVNAYVGPLMREHLGRLGPGIRVVQSSGALAARATAAAEPVRTILSGPAAGVVGAADRARRAGFRRVITLDMGGTSTDVSLVDGAATVRAETAIGGLPVRVPAIDIHTVGAGGGSLARLDAGGALRVGPESAGADPGPACYGRALLPTVTDANLVLGRLVEDAFLGGEMAVDRERARRALGPLARGLGRSVETAAAGVLAVVTAAMERALRVITVERGSDPRDFVLVAFGGAGGLHAAELARALTIPRVYVPRHPGLLSAWGALTASPARDVTATLRLVDPDPGVLLRRFAGLERDAARALAAEGEALRRTERTLDVRYAGQGHELSVPYGRDWRRRFDALHLKRFGHAASHRAVEVVALRVRAVGPQGRAPQGHRRRPLARVRASARAIWFDGRWHRSRVLDRDALPPGWRGAGPAVVCEYSATTLVPPGWRVRVDRHGGLVLEPTGA